MALSYSDTDDRLSWIRSFELMFRRPARLQVAALCRRTRNGKQEVLMITSKTTRRWILPKGWPIMSRKAHRTAAIEAYEEAGVIGKAHKKPFASFRSHKGGDGGLKLRTEVLVFLVDVDKTEKDCPERNERDVRWVGVDQAIRMTNDPGLAGVLKKLRSLAK